jgi:hypothetical protein
MLEIIATTAPLLAVALLGFWIGYKTGYSTGRDVEREEWCERANLGLTVRNLRQRGK